MSKLHSTPPSWILSTASLSEPRPVHRLIVLVSAESDHAAAARRVSELAKASDSSVQFLGLCNDAAEESSLQRQLITMAAMVQYADIIAEVRIESGTNWLNVVKSTLQDGDMIVCLGEQRTGLFQRPLGKILESNLDAPVYVISGLDSGKQPRPNWLSQAAVWTGSLGIIAAFTLLQVKIESMPEDWGQTTLMILSVLVEAWLIWIWNGLVG